MPKFNEDEKIIIKNDLIEKGEKLFIKLGLKKVTVDDLVQEVGIAKGSFYAFYTNKEHLYVDILHRIQKEMWEKTKQFLQEHKQKDKKKLTTSYLSWAYDEIENYPMMLEQNAGLIEYLFRKIPKDIMAQYPTDDTYTFFLLQDVGVQFKYDMQMLVEISHALDVSVFTLRSQGAPEIYKQVRTIFIEAVVNQVVE